MIVCGLNFVAAEFGVMEQTRELLKWLFGIHFPLAGANHFVHTDFYVSIMPAYPPWHTALWARLPLQGVLITWAFWFTRPRRKEGRIDYGSLLSA